MIPIVLDLDGTVFTHDYPLVGKDIGAIPVLLDLQEEGCVIIPWTMRSGQPLDEAISYLCTNNIVIHSININPTQHKWTLSPKPYGHVYIDDAALGVPLIKANTQPLDTSLPVHSRDYVDWKQVRVMLEHKGILPISADTIRKLIEGHHISVKHTITDLDVIIALTEIKAKSGDISSSVDKLVDIIRKTQSSHIVWQISDMYEECEIEYPLYILFIKAVHALLKTYRKSDTSHHKQIYTQWQASIGELL